MKPKVLHLITVYNGRAFVPRAIKSAMRMDRSVADIDVLVLDDASPEPGWSQELEKICDDLDAQYYCTPLNLGIPRNCSLGLATAVAKNYDYVTINNSDVIFPRNLINIMVEACQGDRVGSVTAWSNNVSIYSLPNVDPDRYLASQETVDFLSDRLAAKFGSSVIDIPAGISFCIMMPVDVVRAVGVMDPIFGRGYCEETDWSLRSLAMGYRLCLAPGTFVYHQGRGSNLAAGLVSGAHTTVPENEAIIDHRYPEFRSQCDAFEKSGIMPRYKAEAIDYLLQEAAERTGFNIVPGWDVCPKGVSEEAMRVEVHTEGQPHLRYFYAGFEQMWPFEERDMLSEPISRFGENKVRYNAFDQSLAETAQLGSGYPQEAW
jgi:GT2 family glycosyltransferase